MTSSSSFTTPTALVPRADAVIPGVHRALDLLDDLWWMQEDVTCQNLTFNFSKKSYFYKILFDEIMLEYKAVMKSLFPGSCAMVGGRPGTGKI